MPTPLWRCRCCRRTFPEAKILWKGYRVPAAAGATSLPDRQAADFAAPVQTLRGSAGRPGCPSRFGRVQPTYDQGYREFADLRPGAAFLCVGACCWGAMPYGLAVRCPGLTVEDTLFTGVETRTSSPVRHAAWRGSACYRAAEGPHSLRGRGRLRRRDHERRRGRHPGGRADFGRIPSFGGVRIWNRQE